MIGTRKCDITVMGTARAKVNWSPTEFSKSTLHDERYNTLYYMNDPKGNFRMFCWIDNNIVKMVSNVYMGTKDEVIMKPRKNKNT
mmetsp:Transcript_34686/g.35275  ORF Transcript_34686/g.35275 Transcript_34686/m.35275 type:complete len:85 (-) Transcript_34686:98-352(-)